MAFDMDTPMRGCPVAVFDLETTGSKPGDRICEVGVVIIDRFLETEPRLELCTLVDPDLPDPWQATFVHRITARHVREAPAWDAVWPDVAALFDGRLVVAYNAPFDLGFLTKEAGNICSTLPVPDKELAFDPLRLVKRLDPAPKGKSKGYHSLSAACERRAIRKGEHRAGGDALATAILLGRLVHELYRGKGKALSPPPSPTVAQLLAWSKGEAAGEAPTLLAPLTTAPLEQAPVKAPSEGHARLTWAVVRRKEGGTMYLTDGRGTDGSYRWALWPKNARRFATQQEAAEVASRALLLERQPSHKDAPRTVIEALRLEHLVGAA